MGTPAKYVRNKKGVAVYKIWESLFFSGFKVGHMVLGQMV